MYCGAVPEHPSATPEYSGAVLEYSGAAQGYVGPARQDGDAAPLVGCAALYPLLRHVDRRPSPDFVKAYGHIGFFKSLEEIVHFYNTRDVEDWPLLEVAENVNTD